MVPSADRRPWSLLALLLLLAVLPLCMSWRLVDTDTLLRLAVGRTIAQQGGVPTHDPLTFSDPTRRWSNPEWLGDLLWYGAQRVGGESALIGLRWLLLALALVLLYQLALRGGARSFVLLPLFLLGLLGSAPHLAARNHLHAYWLIALYGLLLERARRQPKALWLLLPLGVLWANLHSSFVMGWLLVGAALLEALLAKERSRVRALAALLLLHPLLAAVSPHGIHAYAQLIDHALGAATYRHWIAEWRPPSAAGVPLFALPLHLIGIVGLLSCLPRVNRRRIGALALLLAGLYFAHSSTRFMPLLFALALPAVASNLQRLVDGRSSPARAWGLASVLASLVLLGLCLYGGTLLRQRRPLEQNNVARPMARFVGRNVPAGTRLFNPYNAGPWLQWYGGGKVPLYIDPRNNLGAAALRRYLAVLKDERQFEREVQRLRIDLALVDLADGAMSRLAGHLQQSTRWRLIYLDGYFALYLAEGRPRVAALAPLRYNVLRGQLDLDYLRDLPAGGVLAAERERLSREGPALAAAIAGYRLLLPGGAPPSLTAAGGAWDRGATTRAAAQLERALPQLPPSAALMSYLATAWARLGRVPQAAALVRSARGYFPSDTRLRFLQRSLVPTKP